MTSRALPASTALASVAAVNDTKDALVKNLRTFIAFARKRVGDAGLAEDVVQESFLKALNAARKPDRVEDSVAWFYSILRRSIIDLYRRHDARARAIERFEKQLPEQPTPADEREICACLRRLLPLLPESYREVIELSDLNSGSPAEVAARLGVSRNNLAARLHRARKQLRSLLEKNCGACSKHGCADCACD